MKIRKLTALLLSFFCLSGMAYAGEIGEITGVNDETIGHNYPPMPAPMIEYDQWGNISKKHEQYRVVSWPQYTEYVYDEEGRLLREFWYNDGYAYTDEYEYDENGICVRQIAVHSDGTTDEYACEYDERGNLLRLVGADGSVLEYTYEYREDGSYKVILPDGTVEEYGSDGILDFAATKDGFVSTYDEKGRMISESFAENDQEKTWTYSEEGKLVQYCTNLQGTVAVYEYDEDGYLLKYSVDNREPFPDEVWEFSRTGAFIRESGKTDEGEWFIEYREDGTISIQSMIDYCRIHREDGYPFKYVYEDKSYEIYRYDENNLFLGIEEYDAEDRYTRWDTWLYKYEDGIDVTIDQPGTACKVVWDEDAIMSYSIYEYDDEGYVFSYTVCEVVWNEDPISGEDIIVYYVIYEYDAEGNVLSRTVQEPEA